MATNVGGGILGLPFAFYRFGLPLGLAFTLLVAFLCHFSTMMYLNVKDMTIGRYESVYEIAYALFGRFSIFFVCSIMFLNNFGSTILYYMVIGDTCSSLSSQILMDAAGGVSEDKVEA